MLEAFDLDDHSATFFGLDDLESALARVSGGHFRTLKHLYISVPSRSSVLQPVQASPASLVRCADSPLPTLMLRKAHDLLAAG